MHRARTDGIAIANSCTCISERYVTAARLLVTTCLQAVWHGVCRKLHH